MYYNEMYIFSSWLWIVIEVLVINEVQIDIAELTTIAEKTIINVPFYFS